MLWYADYFSTDRLFYSNATNTWLGAPNAALFGLRNNHGQNNTVRTACRLKQPLTLRGPGMNMASQHGDHAQCI